MKQMIPCENRNPWLGSHQRDPLKRRAGVELTKITGLIPISNWNKGEKKGDWEVLNSSLEIWFL